MSDPMTNAQQSDEEVREDHSVGGEPVPAGTALQQLDQAFRQLRAEHPDSMQESLIAAEGSVDYYRQEISRVEGNTANLVQIKEAVEKQIALNEDYMGDMNTLLTTASANVQTFQNEINKRKVKPARRT